MHPLPDGFRPSPDRPTDRPRLDCIYYMHHIPTIDPNRSGRTDRGVVCPSEAGRTRCFADSSHSEQRPNNGRSRSRAPHKPHAVALFARFWCAPSPFLLFPSTKRERFHRSIARPASCLPPTDDSHRLSSTTNRPGRQRPLLSVASVARHAKSQKADDEPTHRHPREPAEQIVRRRLKSRRDRTD